MAKLKAVVDSLDGIDEKFHELYTERNGKFEITGVEGMRTQADVDRIQEGLTKERNDHKKTKEKWASLSDKDPEEILTTLDRVSELEAAAGDKLDENKINELVEKRLATKTAPLQREIEKLQKTNGELTEQVTGFESANRQRTIQDSAREVLAKSTGFQNVAIEDALLFAERHLTLNEEGKVVTKDNVGVTPGVEPHVWLTEMQDKKPHWWGATQGGGANGNKGNGGQGGSNPWSAKNWNMTEQARVYRENPGRAEQLAQSAGTKIGGPRPAAPAS